jgi:C4-dicarboxylate-specific signal transduction histidine kinase
MYTTAQNQEGMGLGLTITRRLVRAMGGSITAANRKDGGAVFTVIIPHLESS